MSNTQLAGLPQFTYGSYNFPATFQETKRSTTLAFDKQKIPFNYGSHAPANTGSDARTIELKGPVGSLLIGSGLNVLVTADDLENERCLLAGLQLLGRQQLCLNDSKYIWAFLESFEYTPWQDSGGRRYADWTLTFWADDPRYLSLFQQATTQSQNAGGGLSANTINISTPGNCRAYPTFLFTATGGAGNAKPYVSIQATGSTGAPAVEIGFSFLTMAAGSTLAIDCDPRPNHRAIAAVYSAPSSNPINGLQFCALTDFFNDYDNQEWLPFIDPLGLAIVLTYGFGVGAAQNYTFNVAWNDRFM